MIAGLIHLEGKVVCVWNASVVLVCADLVFIGYIANQPNDGGEAPKV
jgi:hypothetical protein